MSSLIRAASLRGYAALVQNLGGDPGPLLAKFRIPSDFEADQEGFLAFEAVALILEATVVELDCPDFGLRLSHSQGLEILGPVAVIARNAQTLEDAMASIGRYLYVHSPALKLAVAPPIAAGGVRYTYEVTELPLSRVAQAYELSMAIGVSIVRLLSGGAAVLSSVSFLHEQRGPDSSYAETLGCPVRFAQSWCGFELSLSDAARRIDNADAETRRIATKYLETEYAPAGTLLTDQVVGLSRRLLPTGHCTVEAISEQLLIHPRTLQRRLREEDTSCQDVIESVRRDLAVRYLAEPGFQLGQIAGLLGYTEQSSLNRSCQRWFGSTPRQYRAELRQA